MTNEPENPPALIIGEIYEIRTRIVVNYGHKKSPERLFMKLIGFSSRHLPVFQNGEMFQEVGGEWEDILPLRKDISSGKTRKAGE